jgi:hypothetical protein
MARLIWLVALLALAACAERTERHTASFVLVQHGSVASTAN